jgi:hypothetical protein
MKLKVMVLLCFFIFSLMNAYAIIVTNYSELSSAINTAGFDVQLNSNIQYPSSSNNFIMLMRNGSINGNNFAFISGASGQMGIVLNPMGGSVSLSISNIEFRNFSGSAIFLPAPTSQFPSPVTLTLSGNISFRNNSYSGNGGTIVWENNCDRFIDFSGITNLTAIGNSASNGGFLYRIIAR